MLRTYHLQVVILGLFLRLALPQPVLQGPASKQNPPSPQSEATRTVVGQNPHSPFAVSTLQLKPGGAILGLEGSPST